MKPIVGITMGDPAGIGPEVVLKALARPEIYQMARPIVIGDLSIMKRDSRLLGLDVGVEPIDGVERAEFKPGQVEVLSASDVDLTGLEYGRVDPRAGEAAVNSVFKAIDLALAEKLDAIVTAPLNKEAMQLAGFKYPGHTEILAEKTGAEDFSLMLVANKLRVIHVTTHISMRQALALIEKDRVLRYIRLAQRTMAMLGAASPKVAVAGLNCHAGEHGLFGEEDIREIEPAVRAARDEGIDASGPWPPDTVFYRAGRGEFDIVVAMYHDQGHIAVKMLGLDAGVNMTAGLPIIRTSVDHGTAFDIAGRGVADDGSMMAAIQLAVDMALRKNSGASD